MEKEKKFVTINTVMNESFNLYFKNFLRFVIPVACVYLPMIILIYAPMYSFGLENIENYSPEYFIGYAALAMVLGLLFIPLYYVLIKVVSHAYTDKQEEMKPLVLESLRRFFPFWWMHVLLVLLIWLGALLLIVPMFIIMIARSLSQVVFVLEGLGPVQSLKRSKALTKGYKGKIFVLFFLVGMILYTLLILFAMLGAGAAYGVFALIDSSGDSFTLMTILMMVLYSLISIVMVPLYPVFMIVIYYNILKTDEGYETVSLASSFLDGGRRHHAEPSK